jgi:hypothetical protein
MPCKTLTKTLLSDKTVCCAALVCLLLHDHVLSRHAHSLDKKKKKKIKKKSAPGESSIFIINPHAFRPASFTASGALMGCAVFHSRQKM